MSKGTRYMYVYVFVVQLRLQYETFPRDSVQASRLAFLVRDLEVRDRLAQSNINKFLYQYSTESMPRQSHANMVSEKIGSVVHVYMYACVCVYVYECHI